MISIDSRKNTLNQTEKALFFVAVLLLLVSFGGNAQTVASDTSAKEVSMMPFLGPDDPENTLKLHSAVVSEVNNRDDYTIQEVSSGLYPEILDLHPDMPPEPKYLGSSKLVLTGEFYLDTEDLQHFQLWLWDSETGKLVYTDEMVSENYEEALTYVPPLVNWLFSQVPKDPPVIVEKIVHTGTEVRSKPAEDAGDTVPGNTKNRLFLGQLSLGLRGGAAVNTYQKSSYSSGQSQSLVYEIAFLAEFRILRFLGLQAEVVFSPDIFNITRMISSNGQNISVTDQFSSLSLTFPLLIKIPLEFGIFTLSLHTGPYGILPLGNTRVQSAVETGTYAAKTYPPIGFIVGLDLGFLLGPGRFILDMRYGRDFGVTTISNPPQSSYTRDRISISVGYKFLLWNRK